MRYSFDGQKVNGASGAIRGRAVGPQRQLAVFEISFKDKRSHQISAGGLAGQTTGIGGTYSRGSWWVEFKELNFKRHQPRTGLNDVPEKLCRWTTGEACRP